MFITARIIASLDTLFVYLVIYLPHKGNIYKLMYALIKYYGEDAKKKLQVCVNIYLKLPVGFPIFSNLLYM